MSPLRVPSLLLFLSALFSITAQGAGVPVPDVPSVVSAESAPVNVRVAQAAEPATQLRLEDPRLGGVLHAADTGTTYLLGPAEETSFLAGVEIEFLEPGTSVEVRVIDTDGAQANVLVISSPNVGRWRGDLCQLGASQNARMDLSVISGSPRFNL